MSLLHFFWIVSWSLCAFAGTFLVGLVIRASWSRRSTAALRLKREHYIELLKADVEGLEGDSAVPADDVLTDLIVEVLELVRGDEKARFAERVAKAGIVARLHSRLRRGGVRGRIMAAAALANFSDKETQSALTEALDDRSRKVARIAALSLAATGNAPSLKEVIRRIRIGEHAASLLILMLLVETARSSPESVRSLLIDLDTSTELKAVAAQALGMSNDVVAVPVIVGRAIDADPAAIELPRYLDALADIAHPAGSPAVVRGLDSASAEVRAAAARAAGRIGIEPALDRLEGLVGDPDWWVRFQAARALLRFGEEGQRRLNATAGRDEEPARETAAQTLAEHAHAA